MTPATDHLKLHAENKAQAVTVPDGFEVLGGSDACPIALTVKGEQILTTQFHPEFDKPFMDDLMDFMSAYESEDTIAKARAAMEGKTCEGPLFAKWIKSFVEG